jgi:hypothetical protein
MPLLLAIATDRYTSRGANKVFDPYEAETASTSFPQNSAQVQAERTKSHPAHPEKFAAVEIQVDVATATH